MITSSKYIPGTPLVDVITLDLAKQQLKIEPDFNEEDILIEGYIAAAIEVVENYLGRAIHPRQFVLELDKFDLEVEFAKCWENDAIDSINYYAPGETETLALADSNYVLRNSSTINCKLLKFKTITPTDSRDDAVIITIAQGLTVETIPAPLKQAMLLILSDMYEKRDDREIGVNSSANALMRPYRRF